MLNVTPMVARNAAQCIAAVWILRMSTHQPSQKDYRVRLEAFEGPLDLLLFLVRRAEVDLQDIPIAEITDQYLDVLHHTRGDDVDIEQAGEFLVMAATLVEIKSRSLTPLETREGVDADSDDQGDPRDELIRQLLAYQRIRAASESLDARKHEFAMRFPVSTSVDQDAIPRLQDGLELDDVHVMDLADAYERIASSIDFARLGDHVVELDDTPIALYEQDLVDQLGRRTGRSLTLQDAFAGREPIQRVGMFLAVLELIRQFRVRFEQDGDGPIALVLQDEIDQED
jgi:segregation and condensation protein A